MHPLVQAASTGTLPEWAVASPTRRAHMARVGDLLGAWSEALALDDCDATRWRASGYLHDALREVAPGELRPRLPVALAGWPDLLLHGPAAAERLRVDGVLDGELLEAIAYHTVGHAGFGRLGRALYAADFLDPERPFLAEWRAELRGRMPHDLDGVTFEILRARMAHMLERGLTILPRTVAFWNVLAEEQG